MSGVNVLIAGESQQTIDLIVKGADTFWESTYMESGDELIAALEHEDISVDYLPCHSAAQKFPDTLTDLSVYDAIVLSDIGSRTLSVPPSTVWEGETNPERLPLIADYVEDGGSLLMIGGYMSFQGIEGKASYRRTAIERILPVSLAPGDDRVERSAGASPVVEKPSHPIVSNLEDRWPKVLGYNHVTPDDDSTVVATVANDPLLVVGNYGDGQTAAFTSDCAPHWASPEFMEWDGYQKLWSNLIKWLGKN
ncbi:Uncharacterized membrane protein [Halorientalis persicus]|jgi:uncharacterized membrane protein|uniref:Uncharacterized membrane protein n=1 Tax=Halorientalis persicus TaxID=1367881 RepID=A0A1H8WG45_9EURY|nr:glutamine amidotransferase [Halorientalis persicus]SEP26654.1 Uncharacterized membrane protein [Halorientalis persicus]